MDKWPIFDQNHGKSSGADWCNLVHSGTTWYTLVNFVQFGVTWCRLVQLGKDWCNLVQFRCNLVQLGEYLNSIHSNIKFTHEYSVSLHQSLPFLDVQVHLSNNQIHPDLHPKPTDKHQYLLKSSFHPNHKRKLSHSASFFEYPVYLHQLRF